MFDHHFPQQRAEASPDLVAYKSNLSASSSVESLRRETPSTPPQASLSLSPMATLDGAGFSSFFPWIKQDEDQVAGLQGMESISAMSDHPKDVQSTPKSAIEAFQQRDAAYLPRASLLSPVTVTAGLQNNPLGLLHDSDQSSAMNGWPRPVIDGLPSSSNGHLSFSAALVAPSSANSHAEAEDCQGRISPVVTGHLPSPTQARPLLAFNSDQEHDAARSETSLSLSQTAALPPSSPCLSRSRALRAAPRVQKEKADQPGSTAVHRPVELTEQPCRESDVVLDIYEDDNLPGYQIWKRGSTSSTVMAVRIPRQMIGWKAVLMEASGFGDTTLPSAMTTKKARRASKVLGKQGWEVRQEALKNSYDFRRGSGIWATMHAGHRLFKHDWHLIIKDGSRYMWKMDKQALALYRDQGDVRIAEFCKAVASSSNRADLVSGASGYLPDVTKRIGSFKYAAGSSPDQIGAIFDMNLALISLMAVFGARGGHRNVSAAFEPSSDPVQKLLEQKLRETPDREEVMLALPRPGFARDNESVLSDTTDEEADRRSNGATSPRLSLATRELVGTPHATQSPRMEFTSWHNNQGVVPAPQMSAGRNRISSLFGSSNTIRQAADERDAGTSHSPMTDAQRIARQYRSKSMFLG